MVPNQYTAEELQQIAEARRDRERRWSDPFYRAAMEKALGPSPAKPRTVERHLADGGGPERRKAIAELRKVESRLFGIENRQAMLAAERAALMESECVDQRRVDALGVEIEKLARERELAEASIRGWVKRGVDAERKDSEALAARTAKVMAAVKKKLEPATARFHAARRELEASIPEAFGYDAILGKVVPLLDALRDGGDVSIPEGEGARRAPDQLFAWFIGLQERFATRIDAVKRSATRASDDPIENYERLEALLDEIEK